MNSENNINILHMYTLKLIGVLEELLVLDNTSHT